MRRGPAGEVLEVVKWYQCENLQKHWSRSLLSLSEINRKHFRW